MTPMARQIVERWRVSGETKKVEWRHVRLALMLAGLCLGTSGAGIVVWLADTQADAEATAYSDALNEWKRCTDRAVSGNQVDEVNLAGVAHAQETAEIVESTERTLDEIVAVFEQDGVTSPRLAHIRELVDEYARDASEYQAGVDAYRAAAEAYVPQDLAECPPRPKHP